jgi:hypothetical protein
LSFASSFLSPLLFSSLSFSPYLDQAHAAVACDRQALVVAEAVRWKKVDFFEREKEKTKKLSDRGRKKTFDHGRRPPKSKVSSIFSSFKAFYRSLFASTARERESGYALVREKRQKKDRKGARRRAQNDRRKGGKSIFNRGFNRSLSIVFPLLPLLLNQRPYRGMSTPAASQAAMTLAPLGIVTVLPLTVHSIPSTTGAGAGAGVDASERARRKSMPLLLLPLSPLLLLAKLLPPVLPLVLAAAPPSARAAARRAAARAARSMVEKEKELRGEQAK